MDNLFLTGPPSVGKTTAMQKIIDLLDRPVKGFLTREERIDGRRVGFMMQTLEGEKGYLAHQDIESEFAIRRYGVSIDNIEQIAVPSIEPKVGHIIILDEIGKMECFSEVFCAAAVRSLDSDNVVVGTITLGGGPFIEEIKARPDVKIYEVTEQNRNDLPAEIAGMVKNMLK